MEIGHIIVVLILGHLVVGCVGGSRGGSRGRSGSSRRGGGGGGGTGGSRRSSGGSGGSFSSRSPSRLTSKYISYVPAVSYTRAYPNYKGFYSTYYNRYFYYSSSAAYRSRPKPQGDVRVCANYEANKNGTVMGIFTCPLPFEPDSFKYCCGDNYAEFCCESTKKQRNVLATALVVSAFVLFLFTYYITCKIRDKFCRDRVGPAPQNKTKAPVKGSEKDICDDATKGKEKDAKFTQDCITAQPAENKVKEAELSQQEQEKEKLSQLQNEEFPSAHVTGYSPPPPYSTPPLPEYEDNSWVASTKNLQHPEDFVGTSDRATGQTS